MPRSVPGLRSGRGQLPIASMSRQPHTGCWRTGGVKLNRLVCKELFRVDGAEACRVVEAAAGSLIVARRPLPALMRQPIARFRRGGRARAGGRGHLPRRALATIVMLPVMLWLIGLLLHA